MAWILYLDKEIGQQILVKQAMMQNRKGNAKEGMAGSGMGTKLDR